VKNYKKRNFANANSAFLIQKGKPDYPSSLMSGRVKQFYNFHSAKANNNNITYVSQLYGKNNVLEKRRCRRAQEMRNACSLGKIRHRDNCAPRVFRNFRLRSEVKCG